MDTTWLLLYAAIGIAVNYRFLRDSMKTFDNAVKGLASHPLPVARKLYETYPKYAEVVFLVGIGVGASVTIVMWPIIVVIKIKRFLSVEH